MHDFLGSNPVLQVNGLSVERLRAVMNLSENRKAVGYAINTDRNRIVFFQYAAPAMIPFPVPLSMERCADLAWEWVQNATYPREPDHDGDNSRGWLCFTEGWGHIEPYGYHAFIAVEPHWIMFGK